MFCNVLLLLLMNDTIYIPIGQNQNQKHKYPSILDTEENLGTFMEDTEENLGRFMEDSRCFIDYLIH